MAFDHKENSTDIDSVPVSVLLTAAEANTIKLLSSKINLVSDDILPDEVPSDNLAEIALRLYRSRRYRASYFKENLFAEPAWDMLLAAYCFGDTGPKLSICGLCDASACPPTTALRWLKHLEDLNLIERFPSECGGRTHYVRLSDDARTQMDQYLKRVGRQFYEKSS